MKGYLIATGIVAATSPLEVLLFFWAEYALQRGWSLWAVLVPFFGTIILALGTAINLRARV